MTSPFNERIGLIWSERVKVHTLWFVVVVALAVFRGQSQQQLWQFSATIDQADIRGSKPHNLDPSGAASDCYRESGVERKAHYLAMDLPHSDDCFVTAFPAETTEACKMCLTICSIWRQLAG